METLKQHKHSNPCHEYCPNQALTTRTQSTLDGSTIALSARHESKHNGTAPEPFHIGCAHDTIPIVPQLGQDETPDHWRVRRPECCRDKDVTDLTRTYLADNKDYECPDCGAEYTRDGCMIGEPTEQSETN